MKDARLRNKGTKLDRTTGLALAARWQRSGMSMAAFGRKERVSTWVVKYWVDKAKAGPEAAEPSDFYVVGTAPRWPVGSGERSDEAVEDAAAGQAVVMVVPATRQALRATLRAIGMGGGQ